MTTSSRATNTTTSSEQLKALVGDLVPATLETCPENGKHCGAFGGKPGVMCHRVLSKKYLHYQIIGPGSDL